MYFVICKALKCTNVTPNTLLPFTIHHRPQAILKGGKYYCKIGKFE